MMPMRAGSTYDRLCRYFFAGDAVPERLAAVLLVVGRVERLAVARAAAVVDAEDDVPVVHEVLDVRAVLLPRLPAGPAVHPDDRRSLRLRRRLPGLVEDVRDRHAVEGGEAHDLRFDEVRRIDRLRHRVGQSARRVRPEGVDVEIVGSAVRVQLEGQLRFVVRDADRRDLARGKRRQGDGRAGPAVPDLQDAAPVLVHRREAVLAVLREERPRDVPVGLLDVLGLAGRELVTADPRELGPVAFACVR